MISKNRRLHNVSFSVYNTVNIFSNGLNDHNLSYEEILKTIADRHGVTVNEVLEGLEACIDIGMNNQDPAVKEHWSEIAQGKERPTVSDLITYTAGLTIARCVEEGKKT